MGTRITNNSRTDRAWGGQLLIVLAAIVLVLAACGGSNDDSADSESSADMPQTTVMSSDDSGGFEGEATTDGAAPSPSETEGGDEATDRDSAASEEQTAVAPVVVTNIDLGRSIIYTASVLIEVDDVNAASRRAQEEIAAVGGLVFALDTTTEPRAVTTLVFRVPPAAFAEAMTRLEGVGKVVTQDISADDVTDRVVDLQSQILTSEVSVARLRALLDDATTIEAIAALEGQLLQRETNLELLRGQLRTIEAQVGLATITVTIAEEATEASIEVAVTAYDGDDAGDRCPGEQRLEVDEGDTVILCVAIDNVGNVALTDIEVRDLGLDLQPEDFTLIGFGDDDRLAPGDTVIAWASFESAPSQAPYPSVTSVPIDDDGEPLRTTTMVTEEPLSLEVIEDASLPGLSESLGIGWGAVQAVLGVTVVVLGALAPVALLALPVVALYLLLTRATGWRRRAADGDQLQDPQGTTHQSVEPPE